jgi:hypothetical protein
MTTYTDVFGGANIYPSDISYRAVVLAANQQLSWPEETSAATDFATRIMDVSASSAGLYFLLPNATQASPGETILFNNTGADTFTVKVFGGATQVVSVAPGEAWQIYLTVNTTTAGSWKAFQYGAGVSSADASSLAGTGLRAIGALLYQSMPTETAHTNYTAGANDRAKTFVWTGAGGTLTLPNPVTVGDDWFMFVRNEGTGSLVADPSGSATIDSASTKTYNPTESSIIVSDGAQFLTIGFGQAAEFVFDYTSIAVAGSGNYTLTGSELNRIAYQFTGALTGNRAILVPATVQQYWIDNSTTGAYTFTVKVSGGTGVTVNTGQRGIYYCNGTDVVDADTSTLSTPVSVANGGTGSITASAARIALGGTSVGIAVFTAASQAAAWSALGVAQAGNVDGGVF